VVSCIGRHTRKQLNLPLHDTPEFAREPFDSTPPPSHVALVIKVVPACNYQLMTS
jgi:hypothetical protein